MSRYHALVVMLLLTPGSIALAGEPVFPVDRSFYPFYPSLVKWEQTAAPFTAPDECGGCHVKQHEDWSSSIHALAFVDPIYQGELNKGFKAVGHEVTRQCEGCHSAAGVVTGELKQPGLVGLSPMALAGVSCDICHSVSAVTHQQTPAREPENGSLVLSPGKADGTLVKRGPYAVTDGCGEGFHDCSESALFKSADLCASCHQVFHYDKHFPLEATYQEWKRGPYAQQGIACQDCHMADTATFLKSADFVKPARSDYRHFFNGANYLLYALAQGAAKKSGDDAAAARFGKQYDMAIARLQHAAEVEIIPEYANGRLLELRGRVKNRRAGHNLPTSLTNVRQMWLELTVRDEQGKILRSSGTLDGKGQLPAEARVFNSDGMGDTFHFAIDPWVVTAFSRHDTIPPHGYRDALYGLPPLDGKVKQVTVEAKLRYRQADQLVAEALLAAVPAGIDLKATYGLDKVPTLPVVDMVVKTATVTVKQH